MPKPKKGPPGAPPPGANLGPIQAAFFIAEHRPARGAAKLTIHKTAPTGTPKTSAIWEVTVEDTTTGSLASAFLHVLNIVRIQ